MSGNDTLCEERGAGCCCDGWRTFGDYCLPSDYREPTIKNCPNKDHKVLVDATNNVAYLHNHGITATDWVGQPLHVSLSQYEFHHCQCSNSIEVVTATAVDKFGQAATCKFTVSVEDYYKPGFANCPDDQIVSSVERVIWKEPTVTDNVGVWKLSRPRYNNTTRFRPGIYNLSYSASDWSGNVAECSFKITILEYHTSGDSPNSIIQFCLLNTVYGRDLVRCIPIYNKTCTNKESDCCCDYPKNIGGVCLPSDYKWPKIKNCPYKGHRVLVWVSEKRNVAHLQNPGIKAVDWEGQPLHVSLSKDEFRRCQCSSSIEAVTATAVDKFGQKSTCDFMVSVEDSYKPVFENCSKNLIFNNMEKVIWKEPTVKDNVGVRTLSRPIYYNNTRFRPGSYDMIYSATDWSGNVAKCLFTLRVESSGYSNQSDKVTDSPLIISGSVVGILFMVLVVMTLAMLRILKKRRQLHNRLRRHRQHGSSLTSNSRHSDAMHDNHVFMIHNNDPPPYEIVARDKLPDYTPGTNPPSYDDVYQLNVFRFRSLESPIDFVNAESGADQFNVGRIPETAINPTYMGNSYGCPATHSVNLRCMQTQV